MFRSFIKKINHPVVDLVLLIVLGLIVAVSCTKVAQAEPTKEKTPIIALNKVIKNAGCTKVKGVDKSNGEFYNYASFTCHARGNWDLYGENYTSLKRQALDITYWEIADYEFGVEPFWIARCPGYNLMTTRSVGKNFARQYVKKHPECKTQVIDGMTYSRKAS